MNQEKLNSGDRQIEAFGEFWRTLAQHLSTRDPERVFLEVINEPMVEDGYRWLAMQGKLISAIRAGAPQHTIIASGHRWSGLAELLFIQPYATETLFTTSISTNPSRSRIKAQLGLGRIRPSIKHSYPSSPDSISKILDTIQNESARDNLVRYGEDRWDAARIDREFRRRRLAARIASLLRNEFGHIAKLRRL